MPRADRLVALVQCLSGSRFLRLEELTRELGTSARSLYRDLSDLEQRGLPIERVEGSYRILRTATIRPLPLTDRERAVLTVVLGNPAIERNHLLGPALAGIRKKLVTAYALSSAVPTRVAGPDRSGVVSKDVAGPVEDGIRAQHSVSLLYTSLSGRQKRWRGIDPWMILYRCDAWYVVGRCHTHDEPRTFRLDRVTAVLPIGSSFERPEDFNAETWFANSWGVAAGAPAQEAVIVFEEEVAPLIEHARHHPTEMHHRLPDGSLEYRVHVGPLEELARWLVGFGGAAMAVAPPGLVERVREIADGAAGAHRRRRAAAMTRRGRKQES